MAHQDAPHGESEQWQRGATSDAHIDTSATHSLAEEMYWLSECVNSGQVQHAYQHCLTAPPHWHRHAEWLNAAGHCAVLCGDTNTATRFWQLAERANDGSTVGAADASFNLAMLELDQQQFESAVDRLHALVTSHAQHGAGWSVLAQTLTRLGRHAEALKAYKCAQALLPGQAVLHSMCAVSLSALGQWQEALLACKLAIEADPKELPPYVNLAMIALHLRHYQEALEAADAGIAIAPQSAVCHANRALALEGLKRLDDALTAHRTAVAILPTDPDILLNAANCELQHGHASNALALMLQARKLAPDHARVTCCLGVAYAQSGMDQEAERTLREAQQLDPDYPLARLNLAFLLLMQGRLAEAWPLHEARYHPALPDPDAVLPILTGRQWQGEALNQRTLLIWPEQGLGDMLHFIRYVAQIRERGVGHLMVVCKEPLQSLLIGMQGVDRVLTLEQALLQVPEHDYWTFPMSLPLIFATDLDTIPARLPYLHAHRADLEHWSHRMPESQPGTRRVALVWRGNPKHANDRFRSLPNLNSLAPLWARPGLRFVSLQPGYDASRLHDEAPGLEIEAIGGDLHNFADTAAVLQHCDALITVDTAIAHLGGALGIPTCVLLPARETDWRWMRDRTDSPWYPQSMYLYRQGAEESWQQCITRLAADLESILASLHRYSASI